jgi:hypothetical protein
MHDHVYSVCDSRLRARSDCCRSGEREAVLSREIFFFKQMRWEPEDTERFQKEVPVGCYTFQTPPLDADWNYLDSNLPTLSCVCVCVYSFTRICI